MEHPNPLPDRVSSYEHQDPFDAGYLPVSDIHKLYYEQYGNPDGRPVIFLHGGPGGGTNKGHSKYFDPQCYRVVLLDQRGAGKSQPSAELRQNTSQDLVDDIERLRKHLKIKQWYLLFGGSWGSALALLYAQAHPEAVSVGGGLVLRGVFTARKAELEWSRGPGGAARIYPDAYEEFLTHLPPCDRIGNPFSGYYQLLTSDDPQVRIAAARAWNRWDTHLGSLQPGLAAFSKIDDDEWSVAHASLECHFFVHGAWLEDGQILDPKNMRRITHLPLTIVQGRYDIICPPRTAWELHKLWPNSRIFFVPGAGHNAAEPAIQDKLIEVCNELVSC